ncbi:MAG: polysaccharide deacetylase family protein [Eubacteriales bacterium]
MVLFDRFPGGKRFAVTFSYDDGGIQDIRLAELFNKYGMKCTFNLISSSLVREDDKGIRLKDLKRVYEGHELASHTHTHPHLEKMNIKAQYDEIVRARELIEPSFGKIVRGLAYPFGTYSYDTITAMKTAGIEYGRTATSRVKGEIKSTDFSLPEDFLVWDPTAHHNEAEPCVDYFIQNVEKRPWRAGALLYIWGHSYEFDNKDAPVGWEKFEEMLKKLADHAYDIWFATNIEIVDYVHAIKSIRVSADGKMYYNPTDTSVFASCDNEIIEIGAGQTVTLP